jgi:hypothetical protein
MRRRVKSTWAIALLASALLFAQYAVASQMSMLAHPSSADDGCVAQCMLEDQSVSSLDHHFSAAPPLVSSASIDFPLATTRRTTQLLEDRLPPAGPSLQVLYCSYQS